MSQELRRRVLTIRRIYVHKDDVSAHRLAITWLERQVKKDIKILNRPCTLVSTVVFCCLPSASYVECYANIRDYE